MSTPGPGLGEFFPAYPAALTATCAEAHLPPTRKIPWSALASVRGGGRVAVSFISGVGSCVLFDLITAGRSSCCVKLAYDTDYTLAASERGRVDRGSLAARSGRARAAGAWPCAVHIRSAAPRGRAQRAPARRGLDLDPGSLFRSSVAEFAAERANAASGNGAAQLPIVPRQVSRESQSS